MTFCKSVLIFAFFAVCASHGVKLEYLSDRDQAPASPEAVLKQAADGGIKRPDNHMEDLAISPAGAVQEDSFRAKVSGLNQQQVDDLIQSFEWVFETAAPTVEASRPVLEAGQRLLGSMGVSAFEFCDLEAALQEVLWEAKKRQALAKVPLLGVGERISVEDGSTPHSYTQDPGTDVAGADGTTPGDTGGKSPVFGLVVVGLFVLVLGVGMVAKA